MAERIQARHLLRRAAEVYDSPTGNLAPSAAAAWRSGFASGGLWMGQALAELRGTPPIGSRHDLQVLGLAKYGLAAGAGLACVVLAWLLEQPLALLLCVPAFYAVEAQMVFLFPLALDGGDHPFRDARWWTRRAGGTLAVMAVVLPIAGMMLCGGFLGRGFVRSWCVGCLAVCIWYEVLRSAADPVPVGTLAGTR